MLLLQIESLLNFLYCFVSKFGTENVIISLKFILCQMMFILIELKKKFFSDSHFVFYGHFV